MAILHGVRRVMSVMRTGLGQVQVIGGNGKRCWGGFFWIEQHQQSKGSRI